MSRLLRAEWLKLRSTYLLVGTAPAAVLLSIAAVAGAALSADAAGISLATDEGLRRTLHVTGTGAVLVLVLGIVVSAGEYRTSTATDTFLTTPRRERVLAAKLVVGAALGTAVGTVTALSCWAVAGFIYRIEDVPYPGGSAEVWQTLAGTVVYAALFGVLGVAIGSFVRNQIVAVVGALAWLLVIEQVLVGLLEGATKWLPQAAGQAIVRTPDRSLLDPEIGAAVLLAYAAAFAFAGLQVVRRRDA